MIFSRRIGLLDDLAKAKLISETDVNVAEFFAGFEKDLTESEREIFAFAAALLSMLTSANSICLVENNADDFRAEAEKQLERNASLPDWKQITEVLRRSYCCTENPDSDKKPLVFTGERLYFYKYWLYENSLAEELLKTAGKEGCFAEDADEIAQSFRGLFGDNREQFEAAEKAVGKNFSVITGGPGTGKTTTVAKLLAGIFSVKQDADIILAAPTGKAASRMTEALKNAVERDDFKTVDSTVRDRILSLEGQTIHRVLGWKFGEFTMNRLNPLSADLIIVDEASMVDIALFYAMTEALGRRTSLILLGDKDQLASVGVGNVLSDICSNSDLLPEGTVSELKTSHRFSEDSGIRKLAEAVNGEKNTADDIINICMEARDLDFKEREAAKEKQSRAAAAAKLAKAAAKIAESIKEKYAFLSEPSLSPDEILKRLNDFKVLCPSKEDSYGVEKLNKAIEKALGKDGEGAFYSGRPVMVTNNNYSLKLFNGDCGVILGKTAYFRINNVLESFQVSVLPPVETVYAMTVHKSQGSEYRSVLIVMPETEMPILTKELLYTAITRAKESVTIVADKTILEYTMKNRASRNSGFRDALIKAKEKNE